MISGGVQGPEAKPEDGTTDYVPLRKSKHSTARTSHITEQPVTWSNWYKHINRLNCFFILFVPLVGCIWAYRNPLHFHTALFGLVYYFNGITDAGPIARIKLPSPLKLYLATVNEPRE